MRIECPFCGARDVSEFTYLGDADFRNPAGPHRELWYHAGGCLSWLRVTRNTRTHEILAVQLAMDTQQP
jgi:methylglutamate dehydrogenase subunit B